MIAALLHVAPAGAYGRMLLGRSLQGRRIDAVEVGNAHSPQKVLVVGCIHGNEGAGIAIARRLEQMRPPSGVDFWLIENLNPDGYAAGRRQNAHGVDLNRNFPWAWRPLRGIYASGPRPLSEPESRLAYRPIRRLRPRYPASAVGWENHRLPGTTAFAVELPAGALPARVVSRYAAAVLAIAHGRRGA